VRWAVVVDLVTPVVLAALMLGLAVGCDTDDETEDHVPGPDPHPELVIEPRSLALAVGVSSVDLLLRNAGTGRLTWSLAANVAWLHLSKASGVTTSETDTVTVVADRYGLAVGDQAGAIVVNTNAEPDTVTVELSVDAPPIYGYTVLNVYPHDPNAFTQGLVYKNGLLYEGTGRHGESSLREVELATGAVLRQRDLAQAYFGEGLAILGQHVFQLTLSHRIGFIYDLMTFEPEGQFGYPFDGWGLAGDGAHLFLSDGSDRIFLLDPESFAFLDTLAARNLDQPLRALNELEIVGGEIYANVWPTDRIARISPRTGEVLGWIDLTGLLGHAEPGPPGAPDPNFLNGIAYDEEGDRLFVTGKYWPSLFEIALTSPADGESRARPPTPGSPTARRSPGARSPRAPTPADPAAPR